jgi:putative toxin-antitoxin system antitoxin component (TIGR02293 family)
MAVTGQKKRRTRPPDNSIKNKASTSDNKIGGALSDVDLIRSGISHEQFHVIAQKIGLSDSQLAFKLGISPRTLASRRGKTLTVPEAEKALRANRIRLDAEDLFGSNKEAIAWLNSPQRGLENQRPVEILDTDVGAEHVQDYLSAIRYGNVW